MKEDLLVAGQSAAAVWCVMLPSRATASKPWMISNVVNTTRPRRSVFSCGIVCRWAAAAQALQTARDDLKRLLRPIRSETRKGFRRVDNLAADHREQRRDRTELIGGNGQIILVQHREIGETPGLQRSAPVIVEGEPGAAPRVEAQRLLARDQLRCTARRHAVDRATVDRKSVV